MIFEETSFPFAETSPSPSRADFDFLDEFTNPVVVPFPPSPHLLPGTTVSNMQSRMVATLPSDVPPTPPAVPAPAAPRAAPTSPAAPRSASTPFAAPRAASTPMLCHTRPRRPLLRHARLLHRVQLRHARHRRHPRLHPPPVVLMLHSHWDALAWCTPGAPRFSLLLQRPSRLHLLLPSLVAPSESTL